MKILYGFMRSGLRRIQDTRASAEQDDAPRQRPALDAERLVEAHQNLVPIWSVRKRPLTVFRASSASSTITRPGRYRLISSTTSESGVRTKDQHALLPGRHQFDIGRHNAAEATAIVAYLLAGPDHLGIGLPCNTDSAVDAGNADLRPDAPHVEVSPACHHAAIPCDDDEGPLHLEHGNKGCLAGDEFQSVDVAVRRSQGNAGLRVQTHGHVARERELALHPGCGSVVPPSVRRKTATGRAGDR